MNRAIRMTALVVGLAGVATSAEAGAGFNVSLVGQWDGFSGSYADVWGDGNYAYLAHFGSAEIDIIDISNPTNPVRVAAYVLPPPNQASSAQDVKVHDGILYIGLEGSGSSVHLVDVRDPANPVGLGDISISGMTAIHNVFYHNGYLYIVDSGSPRVGILDMTTFNPDNPPPLPITSLTWLLAEVGTSVVHDITVVGTRMYACAWDSGLWVYDVSDLSDRPPDFLGSVPGDNTHSCWPTGDGQYVITGEERTGGGITVFRIIDNPNGTVTLVQTDAVAVPPSEASSVHNQAAIGYRVYNSWYGAGLRVYDVHPVSGTLTLVANYDPPALNAAWGIYPFLGQQKVLLSDISSGLWIVAVDLPLPADLDGNGLVDIQDLLALLAAWGPCTGCPEDLDGDGLVGITDLLALLSEWF